MGGRGAGSTYANFGAGIKKEVDKAVNILKPNEIDIKDFQKTGYYKYSYTTTLNGNKYKIIAEAEDEKNKEYKPSKLKYSVKQGNKFIVKNGKENNVRNFIAVSLNKQIKNSR